MVVNAAVVGIIGVDRTNRHIRHVLVDEPVSEFTGPRAERYAELADRKPEELAIELFPGDKDRRCPGNTPCGDVRPPRCPERTARPRPFAISGIYNLRAVQHIVVVACAQLPPEIALVLPLSRRIHERFQMARYRRVLLLEPIQASRSDGAALPIRPRVQPEGITIRNRPVSRVECGGYPDLQKRLTKSAHGANLL